jgi:ligand-binding sensor domain-containing protein
VGQVAAILGLFLLLVVADASAQGRWTAHTSMREVQALDASSEAVWAATAGGVFSYQIDAGTFTRYTAVGGLHGVSARAIAVDAARSSVWIGYADGVIDRLNLTSGAVETFFDIERSDRFTAREINRLVINGDSLFVATSFGIVVFDPVRGEVRDTYSQLGTLAPASVVYDVTVAPLPDGGPGLWAATEGGVAYAPLDATNLQDPSTWTVEQEGLPDVEVDTGSLAQAEVLALAVLEGRLYAGTEGGLVVREAGGTYRDVGVTTRAVPDLAVRDGQVLGVDRFRLFALDAQDRVTINVGGFNELNSIVLTSGATVWVGGVQDGLSVIDAPPDGAPTVTQQDLAPEGPFSGTFGDLTTDDAGTLWAATAQGAAVGGFYRLAPDGTWTDYLQRFVDALDSDSYTLVHAAPEGTLWAASPGDGIVQVTPDGTVQPYGPDNSSLRPVVADFVPTTGLGTESDGTLWVANREAARPLHVRTPDGVWAGLPPPRCQGLAAASVLGQILVDAFGQKWILVVNPGNFQLTTGVLVLDDGTDPADPSDDVCRFINQTASQGTGLPSTQINALAEDREGRIWLATDDGPAYVISSRVAAQDPSAIPIIPQRADFAPGENPFLLNGLQINDVAVDPANRLWMATNTGAFLVQQREGGFEIAEQFTAENSPLFSNTVVAVTVRATTGDVFFATDQGLISYQSDALAPAPEVGDLLVYPNPLRVREGATPEVFIEGLVEETDVRIVAPHGEVVAQFPARGGRARWDGRDRQQELVPSGVYIVVAIGQNGEGTAYGKVAIIR